MEKCHFFCYWSGLVASFGGFLQSYAACAIAGALLFINREFHLTPIEDGLVASMILLGALIGSIITGGLADLWGRRLTLMLAAFLYIFSNLPILFISDFFSLLLIRFVTGIAAGITSLTVPLYLAEISPPKIRGSFVAGYQLAITIGTLVAYFLNLTLSATENWRFMLFVTAILGSVQGVTLLFIPETPKWLAGSGRVEKSAVVLKALYSGGDLSRGENELAATSWRSLLAPMVRKGLWIGVALTVLQQWCGINAVVYYAPRIFQEARVTSGKVAIFGSLALGLINCIATFCSIFLIDRLGRRTLLLLSQTGVAIGLFLFTATLIFPVSSSLSLIFLLIYIFAYAIGLGPIPWVLVSEIYPLMIRSHAIAVMTFLNWLSNFLVVFTFPRFLVSWGAFWIFAVYTAIAFASIWCFKRIIPETKGKSLEEIELSLYR